MQITWEKNTQDNFSKLIGKIPVFLRSLAKDKVSKTAERLAAEGDRTEVTEKDMVDAFFKETPFGFHGPMKTDMQEIGINYVKYGHGQ